MYAYAALLKSLEENPRIREEVFDSWTADAPLCVGPQTSATAWISITCADPINKPGVVGKM